MFKGSDSTDKWRFGLPLIIGGFSGLMVFGALGQDAHDHRYAPILHSDLDTLETLVAAYARSPHNKAKLKNFRVQISIANDLHDKNRLNSAHEVIKATYSRVKRHLVASKSRAYSPAAETQTLSKNGRSAGTINRANIIFDGRKATIEVLLMTHRAALDELAPDAATRIGHDEERASIKMLLTRADKLHQDNQPRQAEASLVEAQSRIVNVISKLRDGQTLSVKPKIASAQDRYHYEQSRFTAYEKFLKLSLASAPPDDTTNTTIEQLQRAAKSHFDLAEEFGENGRYAQAETALKDGNALMLKAVNLVGTMVTR